MKINTLLTVTYRALAVGLLLATAGAFASATAETANNPSYQLDIPSQDLHLALQAFAVASRHRLLYQSNLVAGKTSQALRGSFTTEEAVRKLLSGTDLTYEITGASVVLIRPLEKSAAAENASTRLARADAKTMQAVDQDVPSPAGSTPASEPVESKGISEILVKGARSTNVDIQRTEDDVQPYVVFDAQEIRQSQAISVDNFLKTRLPMNTVKESMNEMGNTEGAATTVNLRGLGANQTLILVDGRRIAGRSTLGSSSQPDISGIPISAVERIEVLPATASGIYGGGATGGVINIITRKDYAGADFGLTYGQSFDGSAGNARLDASLGFNLEAGRTRGFISFSRSASDSVLVEDRHFWARQRAQQLEANSAAIYGAATPPFGRLTNIRSVNGSNLVLDNLTPLNFAFTHVPDGYLGPSVDGGAALLTNAGKYDLGLADDPQGGKRGLSPEMDSQAALLTLRREFGERVEGFLDASWNDTETVAYFSAPPRTTTLAANATNNPFTTAINVSFPTTGLPSLPIDIGNESYQATAGVIVRLPRDWSLAADYAWSRSEFRAFSTNNPLSAAVSTPLSNGTLNVMKDLNAQPLDWSTFLVSIPNRLVGPGVTDSATAALRLSGPIFELPAGAATVSAIVEGRKEELDNTFLSSSVSGITLYPRRSQAARSLYTETRIPLFSHKNALPLVKTLDLQLSARHDRYTTRSPTPPTFLVASRDAALPSWTFLENELSSTDYTVGFLFEPIRDVTVRLSYGTGFLPPSMIQIVPQIIPQSRTVVDPKRGNVSRTYNVDRILGGNVTLAPEESESFSAGVVFTPQALRGLRLSIDYTQIEKTDEITNITDQQLVDREDLFPGRVVRAPLTGPDAALGYTGGVITVLDVSPINSQRATIEAVDFQLDYSLQTQRLGELNFYALATWQPTFDRQVLPELPLTSIIGFDNGVLDWRGNLGARWLFGPWNLSWNAQYFNAYKVYSSTSTSDQAANLALNPGSQKISAQMYHDLAATYAFEQTAGLLEALEITLGVQNVFNHVPPVVVSGVVGYSTYGDPRLRRFTLNLRKRF